MYSDDWHLRLTSQKRKYATVKKHIKFSSHFPLLKQGMGYFLQYVTIYERNILDYILHKHSQYTNLNI